MSEIIDGEEAIGEPSDHAGNHTDGTDDIQSATNAQKGLATAAQITALEAAAAFGGCGRLSELSDGRSKCRSGFRAGFTSQGTVDHAYRTGPSTSRRRCLPRNTWP